MLVGFILSFAFIRMSTRLMRSPKVPWWPGSVVSESGVHLHHLVFGIVTMMIAGAVGFTVLGDSPYAEICAFVFGVGAGLTIDEFALWIYLDDVYWAEEGRGLDRRDRDRRRGDGADPARLQPLHLRDRLARPDDRQRHQRRSSSSAWSRSASPSSASCTGRSASSSSRWRSTAPCGSASPARPGRRRRYGERNPAKQAKAEERFAPDRHTERFKNAFRDIVGGKPSEGVAAATEEALATTREAVEEVRERAERVTRPRGGKDES